MTANLTADWCPVMVEQLFLAVPQGCLRFVIVVFPDHTHLLFLVETDKFAVCTAEKNVARGSPWYCKLKVIIIMDIQVVFYL